MDLERLVAAARDAQASDLHLEAGLPPCIRVHGRLRSAGEPVPARELLAAARALVGEAAWPEFLARRSCDVARVLARVRCRVNVLCTARGVGLAIRLLGGPQATLERLNLHPDLARLVAPHHGLVIVSGPTGSGKSSTLAALLHEVNAREPLHVITLESPIEHAIPPRQCFVRQREVGRDTPSFAQGLYDALREDPDVLVVGELRDPETMRLTLLAAETGHLVLTTLHSSTTAEALQRIVNAFPAEVQAGICAQLADCLVGVVCQRLRFFPERGQQAPECEVLVGSQPVRAMIRQGQFFKLPTALETGGAEGSWTYARWREWLERRPGPWGTLAGPPEAEAPAEAVARVPPPPRRSRGAGPEGPPAGEVPEAREGVLEIPSPDEDLDDLLSRLTRKDR
jgi:twitching motility protein PilT